jgi:hypothetical protein
VHLGNGQYLDDQLPVSMIVVLGIIVLRVVKLHAQQVRGQVQLPYQQMNHAPDV